MDCREFRDLMSFWIDGILDQQEHKRFVQHMNSCEDCRRELREYKDMVLLLRNIEEQALPDGFHERLHSRLAEEVGLYGQLPVKGASPVKWIRWIGAVAAIFVLLLSYKALDGMNQWRNGQVKIERIEAEGLMERAAQDTNFSISSAPGTSEAITDSRQDSFQGEERLMKYSAEEDSKSIETNIIELRTQDVCITPFTLKMMAVNNGIEVIKSDENSVLLKITDIKQREVLYKELSRMGELKDVGDEIDLGEVTIIIIPE